MTCRKHRRMVRSFLARARGQSSLLRLHHPSAWYGLRQATTLWARGKAKYLWAKNDRQGALDVLARALKNAPDDALLLSHIASYELLNGNAGSAEIRLREVVEAAGGAGQCSQRTLSLFVSILLAQYKFDEAESFLAGLPAPLQRNPEVQYLRAHTWRYSCHYAAAEEAYRRVLALQPKHSRSLLELAELLSSRRRFSDAVALHERLINVTGEPRAGVRFYSHALLAQGKIQEGWAHNGLRIEQGALRGLKGIRVWDGSDLSERSIFVIAEGGIGDEFRDAACYEDLIKAARSTTITCDPRLESLFTRSFPQARVWPLRREDRISAAHRRLSRLFDDDAFAEMKRQDYCVLSPDLFYFLKPNAADYGSPSSYLKVDPARQTAWRDRVSALPPGPKIGIAWRTLNLTYRKRSYYTELSDWEKILRIPGAVFVNLQYGDCEEDLVGAERSFGIRIWRWPDLDVTNDIDDVAALISVLDLVLAPNTSTLELAGALGAKAWYMINEPHTLDHFRLKQGSSGQDRLYPSVEIIMADPPGDKGSLISQVADALSRRVG